MTITFHPNELEKKQKNILSFIILNGKKSLTQS